MNADILAFFDARPAILPVYLLLEEKLLARWPDTHITVRRTQISLSNRHLFACVSLPSRRLPGVPPDCMLLSIGTPSPLVSERVCLTVEPYPGRFTNHIPLVRSEDVDDELLTWLATAWHFAMSK